MKVYLKELTKEGVNNIENYLELKRKKDKLLSLNYENINLPGCIQCE